MGIHSSKRAFAELEKSAKKAANKENQTFGLTMRVKKVKYLHDYKLEILFSDKKTKIVDLSDLIKEGGFYFDPLKNTEFFKKVSLDDEKYPLSICWPNDADICPDVLYEMGIEIKKKKKIISQKRKARLPSTSTKLRTSVIAKSKH